MDVVLAPFLTTTTAIRGLHLFYLALKCTVTNCLSALPINQCHKLFICFANPPSQLLVEVEFTFYVGTKGHSRLLIAPHCANLCHTSKLTLRVLKH